MNKNIENIVNHSNVSEKAIERYLVKRVTTLGGLCLKYSNPNVTGYPDRLVLLPCGFLFWIELKSKGKRPTAIQRLRHQELKALGHTVFVVDSKEQVDWILRKFTAKLRGIL